jgi:hypothetical protein
MVPLIDVFGIIEQSFCCRHKPVVQAGPVAHVFGVEPAPQVSPEPHVPQLAVSPPQPSATTPHVAPACAHVRGVHDPPLPVPPHVNSAPPPPQLSGDVQLPQSIEPPQPSPIGPHIAFCAEHDVSPHVALPLPFPLPLSPSLVTIASATSPSDGTPLW